MKNKVLFVVTILVVFLLGLLASSIINRKNEAKYKYVPQVDIGENEPRNEVWVKITHKNINPIYKPPILHLVPTRVVVPCVMS